MDVEWVYTDSHPKLLIVFCKEQSVFSLVRTHDVHVHLCVCVYIYMRVCERDGRRERGRERKCVRDGERERERERER